MIKKAKYSIFLAILAAVCYGISAPVSKILLNKIPPTQMAALLYLGAGFGMLIVNLFSKKDNREARIAKHEWSYVAGMIALDIAAPILLMFGLTMTTSANASLLNNFEIVATSLIALCSLSGFVYLSHVHIVLLPERPVAVTELRQHQSVRMNRLVFLP